MQFRIAMPFRSMKAFLSGTSILIVFLFSLAVISAQEAEIIQIPQEQKPGIESGEDTIISSEQSLSGFDSFEARMSALWFTRKVFLQTNRLKDADDRMELLKIFCQEEGIKTIPFIARVLTFEGFSYLREGNFEKAKNSFELARHFDALSPQPRFELARTYLKGGGGFIRSAGEFLSAIPIHFKNFWNDLIIVRDLSLLIITALCLMFLFFSTFTAIKYNKLLRHELSEYLSSFLDEKHVWAVSVAIFLAPILTIIGTLFIFIYWPIIFFRYLNRKEKIIFIAFFIVLFLAVPALKSIRSLSEVAVNEDIKIVVESLSEEYDPEKIIRLREKIKNHPEDPLYHFLIAGHYKKGGYHRDAFNHYLECLRIDPRSFQTLNNIGNLYFRFEQYPQAVVYYKQAIEARPDFALGYYNMSIAQSENFHFKDSEESLARALSLDNKQIGRFITRTREKGRSDVVDAGLESSDIWQKAFTGKGMILDGLNEGSSRERTAFFLFLNPLSIVSLISLFFVTLTSFLRKPTVTICIKCGRAFCKRCGIYESGSNHCTQCVHLFIKKDGLEPEAKTRKMIAIARYENWRSKASTFASILFPGSAQNLEGKIFRSFFITFLWMIGISWIFLRNYFIGISEPGGSPLVYLVYSFFIMIMVLSWLSGNTRTFFRKK